MRNLILAASLLVALASPAAAQPHRHPARHPTTSFQALAPDAIGRSDIRSRVAPAPAQATGEYACIWGALGRC